MNTIVKLDRAKVVAAKALMNELGVKDQDAMVMGHSPSSEGHVSHMSEPEWKALMDSLNKLNPDFAKGQAMRRKMLAMTYEVKLLSEKPTKAEKDDAKDALNKWCIKYGYLHKPLNSYKYNELPALVTQYEKVYKHQLENI